MEVSVLSTSKNSNLDNSNEKNSQAQTKHFPKENKDEEHEALPLLANSTEVNNGPQKESEISSTRNQDEIIIQITPKNAHEPNVKNENFIEKENSINPETSISFHNINNSTDSNLSIVNTGKTIASNRRTAAVLVENGCKKYGSYSVLNDFNMCVKENTIYGLLGASGCGKTTILSCIVRLLKLDSGNIFICGKPTGSKESGVPGRKIGYMPQEIALNLEFTVEEVLEYFGNIYGMTKDRIKERHNYIMKLLSLDKPKSLIRDLSDGQKRRVSLAVTLIHEPDILILDEPTVGCDPLLRETIWTFLTELVAQKRTTVIVTTHYIEETRQADKIGFMRNGHLLVEDSPKTLLVRYNVKLLDDIVLKLCQQNEDEVNCERPALTSIDCNKSKPYVEDGTLNIPADEEGNKIEIDHKIDDTRINATSATRFKTLVRKNCVVLFRNFWNLAVVLSIPTTSVIICHAALSTEPSGQKIGIINHEMPFTEICQIIEPINCSPTRLSCLYLDSIQQELTLIPFESIEAASEEVRKLNIWGYVKFDKQFSKQIFGRLLYGKRTNVTIQESQIKVKLDMSNKAIGLHVKKALIEGYRDFSRRLFQSCSIDPTGREIPITYETPVFGDEKKPMNKFTLGVIIAMGLFSSAFSSGITYIRERNDGMINRTLVTGVTTLEIIVSHVITQIGIGIVQCSCLIIFLLIAVSNQGSYFLTCGILFLAVLSGISIGFLGAMFAKDEKIAILIAVGSLFPIFLGCGLFWVIVRSIFLKPYKQIGPHFSTKWSKAIKPMESAPKVLRFIASISPPSKIYDAFNSIVLRGSTISNQVVWEGILASSSWIFFPALIVVAKNWRNNH